MIAPLRPQIRLVAVDLDGTLLDPSDRVTARTAAAIARAQAHGLMVVPVTGRPDRLVWDIAAGVGLGPLGVCSNGAVTIDLSARRILDRTGFPGPDAVALVDLLRDLVPGILIGADEGDVFVHEAALFDGLHLEDRPGRLTVDDLRTRVAGGCLKLVARRPDLSSRELARMVAPALRGEVTEPPGGGGHRDPTRAVERTVAGDTGMDSDGPNDLAEVTASDIAWVDIGPAGLTKATGLNDVCTRLGLSMDTVAAIGDHFNDLPMLRAAGFSGAMGNGIAEVRATADIVVPSNAEDGVAVFLDGIVDRQAG